MQTTSETLALLKNLGLSQYESNAYIALTQLISANATQISTIAQVPRSRVYSVLKGLAQKGFIEMARGKPLVFSVVPPHDILEEARKRFSERADKAEAELVMLYETQVPKIAAPIWLLHGKEKVIRKELEVIGRAKKTLYVLGGFMLQGEIEILRPGLERAAGRGVRIRVMAPPTVLINRQRVRVQSLFKNIVCELRTPRLPKIKAVMRDSTEMVLGFCRSADIDKDNPSLMGIWHQYPEFSEAIATVYDSYWTLEK